MTRSRSCVNGSMALRLRSKAVVVFLKQCLATRPRLPARWLVALLQRMRWLVRTVSRPVGYLLFVAALGALSAAARLLGERDELGFFSGRLASMLWRYPEVIRPGIQAAWLTWAILFVVALSPLDPIASSWDEVALGGLGFVALWHHFFGGKQAGH